jgi:anti-sigma B factor antagonist
MPAQVISVTVEADRAIVRLEGEHEVFSADKLSRSLAGLIDEAVPIVVDLTHASFIDSTVVGVLLSNARHATERGLEFTLLLGPDTGWPVRRVLEVTGLDSQFDLVEA